jgi:hypothetical protein
MNIIEIVSLILNNLAQSINQGLKTINNNSLDPNKKYKDLKKGP